ncbi:MAG: hypothetical protein LUC41_06765, partial [Clostridiales bacterium]|nr:hypothetical protein [Clostridiales bacterium]
MNSVDATCSMNVQAIMACIFYVNQAFAADMNQMTMNQTFYINGKGGRTMDNINKMAVMPMPKLVV